MENFKVIHKVSKDEGIITKYIQYGDKKFKLRYECVNGCSGMRADIMNSEGYFEFILSDLDIDFTLSARYVHDISYKESDADKGFRLLEKLIKKLY